MALAAACSALVLLLAPAARPNEVIRQLDIPGHGALEIGVPAAWRFSIDPTPEPTTMRLEPESGSGFVLTITPHPLPPGSGPNDARYHARHAIERTRRQVAPTAVEEPIAVEELRGGRNVVFWFAATDKAPQPGEHERLVMGVAAAGELMAVFTLLHHEPELPERAVVLRAMAEARHVEPASLGPFALALPGKHWALLADLAGFEMEGIRTWADGSGVTVVGRNRASGVVLTMFLERVGDEPRAKDCRAAAFERAVANPFEKVEVKRTERDDMAVGEYLVPRFRHADIRQKHVTAYLAKEDVCAQVHLSKRHFEPADQALFEAVLRTVRLGASAP